MKMLLYFVLLLVLWIAFIPAMNDLQTAPSSLRIWFVVINSVVSIKLLVDVHTTYIAVGPRGHKGSKGDPGRDSPQ